MSIQAHSRKPVKIFASYSEKDKLLKDKLWAHLNPLQRQGIIDLWDIQRIEAGSKAAEETRIQLEAAEIILCLISADFIASEHYTNQVPRAFQRQQLEQAILIPILLRHAAWQQTPLKALQIIPRNQKPIENWPKPNRAIYEVAQEIVQVIESIRAERT